MQNSVNVAALIQQRQNKFIETRTIIEAEVNKFLAGLEAQDDDIKAKLNVQPGITARHWLPSLWSDDFNMEAYKQELAKLTDYMSKVKVYADNLNAEAIRCLQS